MQKKLPKNKYPKVLVLTCNKGFTLVEILIALSIMALIFGSSYANYRGFSRNQALLNFTKNIQADLRAAQSAALAGQKPTDASCNGTNILNGYFFNVLSATHYEIRASCSGGTVANAEKDVLAPSGITITVFPAPNPILFKVLGSGTNISSGTTTITARQAGTGATSSVTISAGGQIQ